LRLERGCVRVYPGQAEVGDQTEHGEFAGERVEAVTYLTTQ
jgi:hypothetical protein